MLMNLLGSSITYQSVCLFFVCLFFGFSVQNWCPVFALYFHEVTVTTSFHEHFSPRNHEPPAWLYPVPYGCAALYTFLIFFNPRGGGATQRKPTTLHPQRTRSCTRLSRANTQGTHLFFYVVTRTQRTRAHFNPQHWFLYHMGLY